MGYNIAISDLPLLAVHNTFIAGHSIPLFHCQIPRSTHHDENLSRSHRWNSVLACWLTPFNPDFVEVLQAQKPYA